MSAVHIIFIYLFQFEPENVLKERMDTKIDQKVAKVENPTSCHFKFIGGFWRHSKGSGFVFQIRSIFAKKNEVY